MNDVYSFIDDETLIINNIGTLPTPCILSLTPLVDINNVLITGLSNDDIELSSLKANSTYIINGKEGIITEDGINNISKYNGWTLPFLKPGENVVHITNLSSMNGSFSFTPRY